MALLKSQTAEREEIWQVQHDAVCATLAQLQADYTAMSTDTARSSTQFLALQAEHSSLHLQHEAVCTTLTALQTEQTDLQARLESVQTHSATLVSQIADAGRVISDWQEKFRALRQQLQEQTQAAEAARIAGLEQADFLHKEILEQHSEYEAVQQQNDKLTERIRELESHIPLERDRHVQELRVKDQALNTTRSQLAAVQKELVELNTAHTTATDVIISELVTLQGDHAALQAQLSERQTQYDAAVAEVKKLKAQLADNDKTWTVQHDAVIGTLSSVQSEYSGLQAVMIARQANHDDVSAALLALQAEHKALKARAGEQERSWQLQLDAVYATLATLQTDHTTLQASKHQMEQSWKSRHDTVSSEFKVLQVEYEALQFTMAEAARARARQAAQPDPVVSALQADILALQQAASARERNWQTLHEPMVAAMADLQSRYDALNVRAVSLQSDLAGRELMAQEAARTSKEEFQSTVFALQRQVADMTKQVTVAQDALREAQATVAEVRQAASQRESALERKLSTARQEVEASRVVNEVLLAANPAGSSTDLTEINRLQAMVAELRTANATLADSARAEQRQSAVAFADITATHAAEKVEQQLRYERVIATMREEKARLEQQLGAAERASPKVPTLALSKIGTTPATPAVTPHVEPSLAVRPVTPVATTPRPAAPAPAVVSPSTLPAILTSAATTRPVLSLPLDSVVPLAAPPPSPKPIVTTASTVSSPVPANTTVSAVLTPVFLRTWAHAHDASPSALAVDVVNFSIYVVHDQNHVCEKWRIPSNVVRDPQAAFVKQWVYGTRDQLGLAPGFLHFPSGVAVDAWNNEVYITDSANHRVVVLQADTGLFVRAFGEASGSVVTSPSASSPLTFQFPRFISVCRQNPMATAPAASATPVYVIVTDLHATIHIADASGRRACRLTAPHGMTGRPSGVAISDTFLFVGVAAQRNVQVFDVLTGAHAYTVALPAVALQPVPSSQTSWLSLSVDASAGTLYVVEQHEHAQPSVSVFTIDSVGGRASFRTTFGLDAATVQTLTKSGYGPAQFDAGCIDSEHKVFYALDTNNRCMHLWQIGGAPSLPPVSPRLAPLLSVASKSPRAAPLPPAPASFLRPWELPGRSPQGIAVDPTRNAVVVCYDEQHVCERWSRPVVPDPSVGNLGTAAVAAEPVRLWTFGTVDTDGSDSSHLMFPSGCAIDPWNREVFVADSGNHRIAVLDLDTGKFLRALGHESSVASPQASFEFPRFLAVVPTSALGAGVALMPTTPRQGTRVPVWLAVADVHAYVQLVDPVSGRQVRQMAVSLPPSVAWMASGLTCNPATGLLFVSVSPVVDDGAVAVPSGSKSPGASVLGVYVFQPQTGAQVQKLAALAAAPSSYVDEHGNELSCGTAC
jgi:DNA-binding beta-propeller fold protein YncE